jgi:hypothetical protein
MRTLLAYLFLFVSVDLLAQQDSVQQEPRPQQETKLAAPTKLKTIKRFELHLENGAMLPSGSDLANSLINASYYNGMTLRMGWQTESPYVYSTIYNNPVYGIGWYASTFHNSYIGYPNAIYGYTRIPWIKTQRFTWNYELGFGMSYNFEPFDTTLNPSNLLIGSYRNAYIHLSTTAEYQFTDRFSAGVGLGFKHFSNGSTQQPNAGINLIPATLYGVYTFDKRKPNYTKTTVSPYINNHHFGVFFCPSSKSYEAYDKNYFVSTLSFQYLYQVGYKARWGGGIDLFYKGSGPDRVVSGETDFQKSFSYAVFAGYDWVLTERLSLNIAFGWYLKRHYDNEETTPYYERVCPRYRINKHLIMGLGIKAHKGGADYLEWTLGYTFFKDQNKYR